MRPHRDWLQQGLILFALGGALTPFPAYPAEERDFAGCAEFYKRLGAFRDVSERLYRETGRRLEAKSFKTEDGTDWVFASSIALSSTNKDIIRAKRLLGQLADRPSEGIETANAVTGSVTRTEVMKGFGDVDMEQLWVVSVEPGRAHALSQPNSPEVARLVAHFRENIDRIVRDNPEKVFIELKAGEFVHPETGEIKGIKWTLEEIRRGEKTVTEKSGPRRVTLEQVFSENARIKVDWAVPSVQRNSPAGAYQEASVLYRIGVRVGNNDIRLRPAPGGNREALPFRVVSVGLEPDETLKLLEASRGQAGMSLEEIHRDMLSGEGAERSTNLFKFVKRVYAFLKFWPDVGAYSRLSGAAVTTQKLEKSVIEIVADPELAQLSQVRAQGKLFEVLQEHGLSAPNGSLQTWLGNFESGATVQSVIADIEKKMQKRTEKLLAKRIELQKYVDYQAGRLPYMEGALSEKPLAAVFDVDAAWSRKLEERVKEWRDRYPELLFEEPSQLLARASYGSLGRLPEASRKAIEKQIAQLESFEAGQGGIHLSIDEKGLELWFRMPSATADRLGRAGDAWVSLGAKPDPALAPGAGSSSYNEWIRIPIAQAHPLRPGGSETLSRFLYDEHLSKDLEVMPVRGLKIANGSLTP